MAPERVSAHGEEHGRAGVTIAAARAEPKGSRILAVIDR
jgi:hypothetical protein